MWLFFMERKTRLTVSVCVQEKVTKCHVFRGEEQWLKYLSGANRGSDQNEILHCRKFSLVYIFIWKKNNKKEPQMWLFFMERKTRLTVSVCVQEKVTKCHVFRGEEQWLKYLSGANRGSDQNEILHCRKFSLVYIFIWKKNNCKRTHGLISIYRWFDFFGKLTR